MMVRKESIPKVNLYSSKILFEQVDTRNKKRMAQMLKRKTALSAKDKSSRAENKDSPPKNSTNLPKTDKKDDELLFINIVREKEINIENIINDCNNNQSIDIKTEFETDKENNREKDKDKDIISVNNNNNNINNVINLDCSSAVSNIVNENNNYYNNSSTNNSNNNSLMYKDSQEKEINISNLDNDSFDDIIINKSNIQEEEDNDHKIMSNNLFDYDKDDDNLINKDEHKLREENEFALKYLTSSSDSFVQLDNNLVARAKAQGGDITDSYFQALFPQLTLDTNKSLKNKNYEVIDIIKEEKEIETPLRIKNDNSRHSKVISKESKGSIDLNIHINTNNDNNNNNNSVHKILKKSNKKYNYKLYKKKSIKKILMKDDNKNNTLKKALHKSNTNLTNKKQIKRNNTMSKITKNNKNNNHLNVQNSVSSLTSLNRSYVNKLGNNLNNKSSILFSSFSSNLYTKPKSEYKLNKNIQKKISLKNSYNNILYKKSDYELNDILINKYIENANVNRTRNNTKISKINRHYLKNINNYQKYKSLNTIDKNKKEYNKNKLNTESTKTLNSLHSSKINKINNNGIYSVYYNSLDFTKRNKLSQRYISRRNLINNSYKCNNNSNININKNICKKFKNLNINHSFEKRKIKTNQKLKSNLSKPGRVKSCSKLSYKKKNINSLHKSYICLKRSKTYKKKLKINQNESIIINSSYHKNNKNNCNINNTFTNTCSHFALKKRKFTPFHKKIDYSYVKAKVETGLSEIMMKKLLNNNKKLLMKSSNKKIETEKKQLLIKKCKITMNKTIENFKQMASRIKRKLFKGGNQDKNKNDENNNHTIHSNRNSNKTSCKNE